MKASTLMNNSKMAELKQRLLFLAFAIFIYRVGSHIPLPGVDVQAFSSKVSSDGIMSYLNIFSGGAMQRASILSLGLMPYISSSIIINLLSMTVPYLEKFRQGGEKGRRKIQQITRYLTVVLCLVQSLGISGMIIAQGFVATTYSGTYFTIMSAISLTTGTMFAMWLGEQITERGIGNGVSILICIGIASRLPLELGNIFMSAYDGGMALITSIVQVTILFGLLFMIVFFERAQRRIPVHYARRSANIGGSGQKSFLPLKLNSAGVIPPIFASAIMFIPMQLGNTDWWFKALFENLHRDVYYFVVTAATIMFFAFFYTALTFNPKDMAKNLKNSGGFIPGIRPGANTATYIDALMTKLTFIGSIYLTFIVFVPNLWHTGGGAFMIGGTGLLISAVVIMDTSSQIQSFLMSAQYENLLKKSKKGSNASLLR